ncbi:uncharacterized protein LOC141718461 [Apium graveolens]|uniref:uncharacterized protein LOC141718461 n=1 Tax=Apium graveolens TaxID=4045 RepID=UPI003D7A54CA
MQPPNPNPNYPPQNQLDPNTLYYQQSHTSNYSYYYPNPHLHPPNPNFPQHSFQPESSLSTYDPYYNVAPSNQVVNPAEFDPNSYPAQSYGYEYQAQQPGGMVYQQYQAVSVEAKAMAVPYYSDPNGGSVSHNWAVNEVASAANGVTLPPNGMHQYAPVKPKPVSLLNRRAKPKGIWKKEPKTKVVQSAWCEVCRVSCDTKDVLDKHKSGKKHMKNLEKLGTGSAPSSLPVPVASAGPEHPVIGPPENPNKKKTTQSVAKVVQSAWCEVCKVKCDTVDVLNVHNSGKKHKKNLEKLTSASVPVPVTFVKSENSAAGPLNHGKSVCVGERKSKKKAAGSPKDLETKRRKVVEGGAAVSSVRTCVTCNVVCNSETVFQYHIQGQKHMAMIMKIASQRMNMAAGAM